MRFVNFEGNPALLKDGKIILLDALLGEPVDFPKFYSNFTDWVREIPLALRLGKLPSERVVTDDYPFGPPSPNPKQVCCVGLNYKEHLAEMGARASDYPPIFNKFAASITGNLPKIELPSNTIDWEIELVVVIGKYCYKVTASDAPSYIAGYTIGQDLSDRDLQFRCGGQFSLAKSYPKFGPTGPALVTLEDFENPNSLQLTCTRNGTLVQNDNTANMMWSVEKLVELISAIFPLYPGDLIFTGTPAGIGYSRTPRQFLKPGDELRSKIEGIGELICRFA